MNIIWLDPALDDLESIFTYYLDVASIDVARSQLNKIYQAASLLTESPYIGHISPLDDKGLILEWVIPSTNYILPYSVFGDEIRIYRVFDSRQEPVDSWE